MLPKEIRKVGQTAIKIVWPDGHQSEYPAWYLRERCRCAGCRHEFTGQILIPEGSIPKETAILKSEVLGNYALGFSFSDGHSTGIYSFDALRQICPCCTSN